MSKKKLKEGQGVGQQDSTATVDPTVTSTASFDAPDSSKVDIIARDEHEVSVTNQQLSNDDEEMLEKDSELKKQKQARILSDKVKYLLFF